MSRKSKRVEAVRKKYKVYEPLRKNMARTLLFVNAVFWLGYVVFIYYDMAVVNKNEISADIATIFTFVNAAVIFASGILLGKPEKLSYYFALIVVILNMVLCLSSLKDNFFLISFIMDVVILFLLYQLRKSYLSKP